jgi:peroxiredoxin
MAKVSISTQAPEFTSQDIHGNAVSLSNFTNKKNVLLVFNRGFI